MAPPRRSAPPARKPTAPAKPAAPNVLGPAMDAYRRRDFLAAIAHIDALPTQTGDSLNLKGVAYKNLGRFDEAMATLQEALKVQPRSGAIWTNIGNVAAARGDREEAVKAYAASVRLSPKDPEALRLLAMAEANAGRAEEGLKLLRRAMSFGPPAPQLLLDYACVLHNEERFEDAVPAFDRAAQAAPDNPRVPTLKARSLRRMGRLDEAEVAVRQSLAIDPNFAEAYSVLGMLHDDRGERAQSNAAYERSYELRPGDVELASRLLRSYAVTRGPEEPAHLARAHAISQDLLNRYPPERLREAASNMQMMLLRAGDFDSLAKLGPASDLINYWVERRNVAALHGQQGRVKTLQDRLDLVDAHVKWGDREIELAQRRPINIGGRKGGSKIRLGLMSSDLRRHPVAYFAQPLLELYDKSEFEVIVYSFNPDTSCPMQAHFSQCVDQYKVTPVGTNWDLAQMIADDGCDAIFELGGSTHLNKLECCVYKLAPVMGSWVGYPHSAGLRTIDYILLDPYILPDDPRMLVEKPFIMPQSWVCLGEMGFNDAAVIEPGLPEERRGGVFTFGTMNNPYKFTPEGLRLWARITAAVPGAHFAFVRPECASPPFRENVSRLFAEEGVTADRIDFHAVRGDHLRHYNKIDVALDSFPHVGGTTTLETLWMGVPVVTLVGPAFFERLSYSNVTNAGLGDLCCFDQDSYLKAAVDLAADRDRRRAMRAGLRGQMRGGPLGDRVGWVRAFEQKLREAVGR